VDTSGVSAVKKALEDLKSGKMVILQDDANRENEGDLVVLAHHLTPEIITFMLGKARGLICLVISGELADRLKIPLQTVNNRSSFDTPFGMSFDHLLASTDGVTAQNRCLTVQKAIASNSSYEEFVSPGNIYPLIANPKGVFGRKGQTEGAFDLARLANCPEPAAIICEILNPDGSMARGKDLEAFAKEHSLINLTIADIIKYRLDNESFFTWGTEQKTTINDKDFIVKTFEDESDGKQHFLLIYGDLNDSSTVPLIRIHSECLTGDLFGSRRCDCGPQLARCLDLIVSNGLGVLVYLRQEGRGIGLLNKLKAYNLQDVGMDTIDANVSLGFDSDLRDYRIAARVIKGLGVNTFKLLTNNPQKLKVMEQSDFANLERVPLEIDPDSYNYDYLKTKKFRMGHLLT
jgi:3,4-dihydroxy 2-butanone 4-phosphate synthase / GTP cyclohydrolase II